MADQTKIDFNRTYDLTAEEVKACPCFANLSDEEAREVIATLKLFTKIVFDSYQKSLKKP